MAIELIVESLDQVGEDVKAAYVESDGKFQLDADRYAELKAAGLKKKNSELLGKEKQLKESLGRFERFKPLAELLGEADDDEVTSFADAWKNRGQQQQNGKPDDSARFETERKILEKQAKKTADELAALKAESEKTQRELREYKLWTPLREAFIKGGGNPEDWELARLDLANQGRFGFDDGESIVVLEDGVPSTVAPEKFFKDVYSDQRPKFYKASTAGGSGANPQQSGAGGKTKTMKRGDWNRLAPVQQAAFFKEGGTLTD